MIDVEKARMMTLKSKLFEMVELEKKYKSTLAKISDNIKSDAALGKTSTSRIVKEEDVNNLFKILTNYGYFVQVMSKQSMSCLIIDWSERKNNDKKY